MNVRQGEAGQTGGFELEVKGYRVGAKAGFLTLIGFIDVT